MTRVTLLLQITDLNLLVCDECHRAVKKDPYNCIMQEFYHDRSTEVGRDSSASGRLPVVFFACGVVCNPGVVGCGCLAVVFSVCGVACKPVLFSACVASGLAGIPVVRLWRSLQVFTPCHRHHRQSTQGLHSVKPELKHLQWNAMNTA